jgi:hypothetical protein
MENWSTRIKFLVLGLPLLMPVLIGCSQADQQAAGARIPPPGSDHLAQVYVMADRQNPGPLVLDFLSKSTSAIPEAKIYISRPETLELAQEEIRGWSARPMDWLIVSGSMALEAFFNAQVSWANTQRIVVISQSEQLGLRQELDEKISWLLYDQDAISSLVSAYCKDSKQWPECDNSLKGDLFVWSFALEDAPNAAAAIEWNWPTFFRDLATKTGSQKYKFSFNDGFLTLRVRPGFSKNTEAFKRLNAWITAQALSGLSNK